MTDFRREYEVSAKCVISGELLDPHKPQRQICRDNNNDSAVPSGLSEMIYR